MSVFLYIFLEYVIFIGPTDSLTDSSKLVNVVTFADEDRAGNNLLQIWKLTFGQKTFVQTLSTRFGPDFEVDVQARFAAGVWPPFSADIL